MRQVLTTSTAGGRPVRLSPTVLLAAVVLLLGFASSAGAALPPEGLWQWAAPYAPVDAGHAGGLTQIAAGPNDSIYVGGGGGGWVMSRVAADTGAEIWSETLDPASPGGSLSAIAADASGNVVAAGRYGTRGGDVLVWKCRASNGETLSWTRWDGGTGAEDYAEAMVLDRSGNVYVAGSSRGPGHARGLLLKISPKGKVLWKYILDSGIGTQFHAIGRDGSGNVYVTGTANTNSSESRLVTLKVSPTGKKLWQRTISGLGVSYAGQFLKVKGTAVYVVGRLEGFLDVTVERPVILKYSLAGKTLWKHASGTLGTINDMLVDAKGRVVMVGHTWSTAWGDKMQIGLIEMWTPSGQGDPRGATWAADLGPGAVYPAEFNRVVAGPDGRLFIAGDMGTSLTFGEGDAAVFAWPSIDAGVTWTADAIWRYNGPGPMNRYETFYGLLRTSGGAVYAAGTRSVSEGSSVFLIRLNTALPG